jgi:hypothetical protein
VIAMRYLASRQSNRVTTIGLKTSCAGWFVHGQL